MKKKKVKKIVLKELSRAWKKLYGENFKKDYSGFYKYFKNKLKK